jgi:hypothetical protein
MSFSQFVPILSSTAGKVDFCPENFRTLNLFYPNGFPPFKRRELEEVGSKYPPVGC